MKPILCSLILFLTGSLAWAAVPTNSVADTDEAYRGLTVLTHAMEQIRAHYVDADRVGYDTLLQGALRGMMQTLDAHSQYMTEPEYQDLQDDAAGEFGGVGIVVGLKDGVLVVIAPMEDTPAYRAGMLPGDRIVQINGESTENWDLSDAVQRMRGKPGTQVSLRVSRPGEQAEIPFELVRASIDMACVKDARMLTDGIGYIRIVQFTEKTAGLLEENLVRLEKQGVKAVILDLRNNPGGLLQAAVEVCQLFLPSGALIVSTEGRDPESRERYIARGGRPRTYPLAILINAGSASASEIVSGALQDHGRAVLVGEKSFGKGSVQTVIPLDDGSALRLTIARYLTPSRRIIHDYGIEPDILAPMPLSQLRKFFEARDDVPAPTGRPSEEPDDVQCRRAAEALRAVLLLQARR